MYVPTTAEIPCEYLAPLAQRARDSLGEAANTTHATRGHIIRQAVRDGLLRGMDKLIADDGSVDIICDPAHEIPLEVESVPLTMDDLLHAMSTKRSPHTNKAEFHKDVLSNPPKIIPIRRAA